VLNLVQETKVFQEVNAKLSTVPFPPCSSEKFDSDKYWECYIRHFTVSIYHQSGTCRMGEKGDPYAVTDSKLRVKGTKNLRVMDASIMPQIVSTNNQAACVLIGEVGSHFLLQRYLHSYANEV